jgi:hypothetical protein
MFQTEVASEKEFSDWNELYAWVADEEKYTSRVPIQGLLKNGAKFQEDKYFGSSEYKLAFTEEGLKALCYKLGFPLLALEMTKESELASRIPNDLLSQDNAKAQLSNSEFVINEKGSDSSHGKVCGIVSSSYVGYSNNSFMRDIENVIGENDYEVYLEKTFKTIFEDQLESWTTNCNEWPSKRTYKIFKEWFDVYCSDIIWDFGDDEIKHDED